MFMQAYTSQTYALLRIMTGLLFIWHGLHKLFSFPAVPHLDAMGKPPLFIVAIAGPIELIGGLLVMVGLFTRWAAFLCSGLMAVAYWMAHGTRAFLPIVNMGETAILFCFAFLFISANGGGIWSMDAARGDE